MRGACLNPLGMLYHVFNGTPFDDSGPAVMSGREFAFWFARVQLLSVEVALFETFEEVTWSQTYPAPKGYWEAVNGTILLQSTAGTEADLHRPTPLSNPAFVEWTKAHWRFLQGASNPSWPGGPANLPASGAVNLIWMNGVGHNPGADPNELWVTQFKVSGGIAGTDTEAAFSTHAADFANPVELSATLSVSGNNLVQGENYSHADLALYGREEDAGDITGSIVIRAAGFFTYDDADNVPLYNSLTGGYAGP